MAIHVTLNIASNPLPSYPHVIRMGFLHMLVLTAIGKKTDCTQQIDVALRMSWVGGGSTSGNFMNSSGMTSSIDARAPTESVTGAEAAVLEEAL